MRPVLLALVLAATSAARAETTVPIVIAPFGGRCFDAGQLAEHVRAKVGEVPVTIGAQTRGSRQEVHVSQRAAGLTVEVVARDARGQIVGSARRLVPADVDCATALDVAALIVARAALPLNWREPDRRPLATPSHPTPTAPSTPPPHVPPVAPTTSPHTASTGTTTAPPPSHPTTTAGPPPTRATEAPAPDRPIPSEPRAVPPPSPAVAVKPAAAADATPAPSGPVQPARSTAAKIVRAPTEPGTIVLRTRGPDGRWIGELWATAYGSFGVGRDVDVAGGELAIGFRRGRFGAAARGAIEDSWDAQLQSSAGLIGVRVRRAAVALEAHADVGVRYGALRFSAGPTLPLYIVRPSGVPHPGTSLVPSAAASVRILYHLDVGRVFLTAGLACDVAFRREDLTVTGAGVVTRTPWVTLGPLLGFGVNL